MFEGTYSPPYYNELYGYTDGGQKDIFTNEPGPYLDSKGNLVQGNVVNKPGTTTTKAATTTAHTTTTTAGSTLNTAKAQAWCVFPYSVVSTQTNPFSLSKRKTTGAKHRRRAHEKKHDVERGLFS